MADSGSIRAGKAYVEASLNDAKLVKGLAAVQARLNAFGSAIGGIGARFAAMGLAAATGAGAALRVFNQIGDLEDVSARTGTSVEALTELEVAARLGGDSLEGVETALTRMNRVLASDTANNALQGLSLTLADLANLSPDQQLQLIGERLAGIDDAATRTAAAMEIFGRSGTMFIAWAGSLRQTRERARELGLTISGDMVRSAGQLGDAFDLMGFMVRRSIIGIGAALAPAATGMMNALGGVVRSMTAWIDANQETIRVAAAAAIAIGGIGAAMIATSAAMRVAAFAIEAPLAAFGLLSGAVGTVRALTAAVTGFAASLAAIRGVAVISTITGLLTSIGVAFARAGSLARIFFTSFLGPASVALRVLGLLAISISSTSGLFGAIGSAASQVGQSIASVFGNIGQVFSSIAGTMSATWAGFVQAISAGEIGTAFDLAMAGLRAAWSDVADYFGNRWAAFNSTFADTFGFTIADMMAGFKAAFAETIAFLSSAWNTFTSNAQSNWSRAMEGLGSITNQIVGWALGASPDVIAAGEAAGQVQGQQERARIAQERQDRAAEIEQTRVAERARIQNERNDANATIAAGPQARSGNALWELEARLDAAARRTAGRPAEKAKSGAEAIDRVGGAAGTFNAAVAGQIGGSVGQQIVAAQQQAVAQLQQVVANGAALLSAVQRIDGLEFA